jgi:ubiquinone/menaquinone biosynthesis C-methylase UbiE
MRELSPQEWEKVEGEEHDKEYQGSLPFGFSDYRIDTEYVIWCEDYCYKKGGRRHRGHRTKRIFELMGVPNLTGKVILDVGCGNGQYAVFFALLGAEVHGFDLSLTGISVAQRTAEANGVRHRCNFSVGNAAKTGFPDSLFDIVLFHEVLHHAIKYPGLQAEILRVTKPGGLVLCAESLKGNWILSLGRRVTMRGMEALGDVELTIEVLEDFARPFSGRQIEFMSLLFMAKRIFSKYMGYTAVRWLMFLLKKADDWLLKAIPSLRRYCGECILVLRK